MLKPGRAAQGFGKRVDIRARLEGDPDDPETYYCLDEIWDWGDGTESVSEPDCDPFGDGTELKTNFMDTHYFGAGRWIITLNDSAPALSSRRRRRGCSRKPRVTSLHPGHVRT